MRSADNRPPSSRTAESRPPHAPTADTAPPSCEPSLTAARAQRNRVHLTRDGYAQLGSSFASDMMRQPCLRRRPSRSSNVRTSPAPQRTSRRVEPATARTCSRVPSARLSSVRRPLDSYVVSHHDVLVSSALLPSPVVSVAVPTSTATTARVRTGAAQPADAEIRSRRRPCARRSTNLRGGAVVRTLRLQSSGERRRSSTAQVVQSPGVRLSGRKGTE